MNLFISSFKNIFNTALLFWKSIGMTLLKSVGIIFILYLAITKSVVEFENWGFADSIIISEQVKRAKELKSLDLAVIGDSTAYLNFDAKNLSDIMNLQIESFGTLGSVSFEGYAHFFKKLKERKINSSINYLLMFNYNSLLVKGNVIKEAGYSTSVKQKLNKNKDEIDNSIKSFKVFRDQIFYNIFLKLVKLPIPGSFGEYYHFSESMKKSLRKGNGTMNYPLRKVNKFVTDQPNYTYEMSNGVKDELKKMRDILISSKIQRIFICITPLRKSLVDEKTIHSFKLIKSEINNIFKNVQINWIETPLSLEDRYFADDVHMNSTGRKYFTRVLSSDFLRNFKF